MMGWLLRSKPTGGGRCLNWQTRWENSRAASPRPYVAFETLSHESTAEDVLDLLAITNELLTFKCPESFPSEEPDPPTRSFLVLRRTWDWSPLTSHHFLFINWVEESHLLWDNRWRILLRAHSMTPWSFESARQPWMNSNSFVCHQREYRCTSLLWRVVKLKHSSQGHCHPHLGRINHRLQDGRPLVMLTWYVAVWHPLNLLSSCCRASSVLGSVAAARGVDLKVCVITRSWQTSAEVTGSSRLNGWRFRWVRWDFIRETVTSFNGASSSCQCIIRRKTIKKDRGNNGCEKKWYV